MTAARHDLTIEAGTDWERTLWLQEEDETPKNLTDYTAKMQIREELEAPVIKELSSGSGITITAVEGKIYIVMTDVETKALGITRGVYDLFLTSPVGEGSKLTKLLYGDVYVPQAVTR